MKESAGSGANYVVGLVSLMWMQWAKLTKTNLYRNSQQKWATKINNKNEQQNSSCVKVVLLITGEQILKLNNATSS